LKNIINDENQSIKTVNEAKNNLLVLENKYKNLKMPVKPRTKFTK